MRDQARANLSARELLARHSRDTDPSLDSVALHRLPGGGYADGPSFRFGVSKKNSGRYVTWVIQADGITRLAGLEFAIVRGPDGEQRPFLVNGEYDESKAATPFVKWLVVGLLDQSPRWTDEGARTIRIDV